MSEPTNQNTGSQGNQGQQGNVAGVNYGVQNTYYNSGGRQLSKQEYRNRQNLLTQMRTEVESRLTQSIHRAAFVNLGKEQQPQQVQRPWDMSVKVGEQRSVQLPPQTTILDVFDNPTISGKFLILGKPGGGKTTTLLELAEALLERAEGDSNAPIPVILELSSWQKVAKRKFLSFGKPEKYDPSIKEWVLSQLISKGVSQKIGEQWLREKELVLLLDGLDELQPERQGKCVQAINQFLGGEFSPSHLVVCSRKEEYEDYKEILVLNEAIFLEDLTNEQILDYFTSVNLVEFWEPIKGSEKIINFICQPLFLAVTSIAYQQIDVEEWRKCNTEERAIDYLLGAYRVDMLDTNKKSKLYDDNQLPKYVTTQSRLIKIAKIYEFNLFSSAEINLNIIDSNFQKTVINILALLPLALLFSIVCFVVNPPFIDIDISWNILWLLCVIGAYLFFTPESKKHISTKILNNIALEFSLITALKLVILIDIKNIFIDNLNIQKNSQKTRQKSNKISTYKTLIFLNFLFFTLVFISIVSTIKLPLFFRNLFFQLIAKIIIGIIVATIVVMFLYLPLFLMVLSIVFVIILSLELYNFFRRLNLRLTLCLTGQMPWNITRFLDYCTERLILQRVGNRYRFIHRLVQEHFAKLEIQKE